MQWKASLAKKRICHLPCPFSSWKSICAFAKYLIMLSSRTRDWGSSMCSNTIEYEYRMRSGVWVYCLFPLAFWESPRNWLVLIFKHDIEAMSPAKSSRSHSPLLAVKSILGSHIQAYRLTCAHSWIFIVFVFVFAIALALLALTLALAFGSAFAPLCVDIANRNKTCDTSCACVCARVSVCACVLAKHTRLIKMLH